MPDSIFTDAYLSANDEQTKQISLVVCIEELGICFSNRAVYAPVRYGDPGLVYGLPGLVYGSLRKLDEFRDYLSLDGSSLTLTQRLEPEQGRASVSTLNFSFIDKDGYLTEIISPGILLDEILGKVITVQLGYAQVAYPEDYFYIFRGFVTGVNSRSGLVTFQLSDPTLKKRQSLFLDGKSTLTSSITNADVTIPVVSTSMFYQQILGPDASYDSAIKTYIKIDDEYIEYPSTGISGNSFVTVTRGARGTTAVSHSSGADVTAFIQIEDHAIDIALKLMLSGFNGFWKENVVIQSLAQTGTTLGIIASSITLPAGTDAVVNYGLVAGDFITITGSSIPGNNITVQVVDFLSPDSTTPNQVITTTGTFTADFPTTGVAAFRSKYDVYPVTAGLGLTPQDVDVAGHEELKAEFLNDAENSYRFFIGASENGKDFIEKEVYLPMSAYALTRRGRLSVKITKPPLAQGDLLFLTENNILEPQNINLQRATNSRKFFNEIIVQYDADDDGNLLSIFDLLDSDSLNIIGLSSVLPINSRGTRSDLSTNIAQLLTKRAQFLLSRYKRGAVEVTCKVNWALGNLIEAGDVVALNSTNLFLSNFNNGTRDPYTQLYEVTDRNLDIKSGNVTLKLVSGVGGDATDRFGSIAPSSTLASGSTTTQLILQDSYSHDDPKFPFNEPKKWQSYINSPITVHNLNYTVTGATVIRGFDSGNPYKMSVDALPFAAASGYVVDIPKYPTSTDPNVDSVYKNIFAHIDPQATIASGLSFSSFQVTGAYSSAFFTGAMARIHNLDYTLDSGDVTVDSAASGIVTLTSNLSFTPSGGLKVDLIGFADGRGAYRLI